MANNTASEVTTYGVIQVCIVLLLLLSVQCNTLLGTKNKITCGVCLYVGVHGFREYLENG